MRKMPTIQDMNWAMTVARATPMASQWKATTKRRSRTTLISVEHSSSMRGVLVSPMPCIMPLLIL